MANYAYKQVVNEYSSILEPYVQQVNNVAKRWGALYSYDGDAGYDGDCWLITAELITDLLKWGGGIESFKKYQEDNKIAEKEFPI